MRNLISRLFKGKANNPCVLSSEDSLYKVTEQDILKFLELSSTSMEDLQKHARDIVDDYDLFGPWDVSLKQVIVSYIIYKRTGDIVL